MPPAKWNYEYWTWALNGSLLLVCCYAWCASPANNIPVDPAGYLAAPHLHLQGNSLQLTLNETCIIIIINIIILDDHRSLLFTRLATKCAIKCANLRNGESYIPSSAEDYGGEGMSAHSCNVDC